MPPRKKKVPAAQKPLKMKGFCAPSKKRSREESCKEKPEESSNKKVKVNKKNNSNIDEAEEIPTNNNNNEEPKEPEKKKKRLHIKSEKVFPKIEALEVDSSVISDVLPGSDKEDDQLMMADEGSDKEEDPHLANEGSDKEEDPHLANEGSDKEEDPLMMANEDSEREDDPLMMADRGSEREEDPLMMADAGSEREEDPLMMADRGSEREEDPLMMADAGSDKEDDILVMADTGSPRKGTLILRPQSPVQKEQQAKLRCKVCDQWFPNRYFQRKHMLMEHEDQRYECRVCSFISVDPEKLKSHIIKQHVTKKERTESISLSHDAVQVDLNEFMTKHTPRKVMMEDGVALGRDSSNKIPFICAVCERIYTSKYSLERHVRCHTGEKPYKCDVCNFSTSYREHMQRHMTSVHLIVHSDEPKQKYVPKNRRKTEDKNPSTEDVDDAAEGEESADAKKRRNILRKRFECAACGLKATHKTDLIEHIKEKHPKAHIESLKNGDGSKVHLIVTVSKKPTASKRLTMTCPYCSKVFHDTWKYKVHMRSHTGVKPFGCSVCPFFATSKMTIRDHMHRKHREIKNPKFLLRTVCIDGTVDHVELNMPQKEFKCNICDLRFEDNYRMKKHKKKEHTDTQPFTCVDCGYKDSTRASMVLHCMEQHPEKELDGLVVRNGKPLNVGLQKLPKCDQCDKIFPYQSQLYNHQKQHTGERSFFCDLCDYSTNHKAALSRHIHKHLAGDYEAPKKKSVSRKKAVKKEKDIVENLVE